MYSTGRKEIYWFYKIAIATHLKMVATFHMRPTSKATVTAFILFFSRSIIHSNDYDDKMGTFFRSSSWILSGTNKSRSAWTATSDKSKSCEMTFYSSSLCACDFFLFFSNIWQAFFSTSEFNWNCYRCLEGGNFFLSRTDGNKAIAFMKIKLKPPVNFKLPTGFRMQQALAIIPES